MEQFQFYTYNENDVTISFFNKLSNENEVTDTIF
jgi:hypothetical protein